MSLRPWQKIISIPYEVITEGMSFDAYFSVWEHVPLLGHYIWNSMFIATSVTILTLIAVIPAAWAFGRFDFKGRAALLTGFLTITMIGPTVFVLSFAFLWTPEMQPLPLGLHPYATGSVARWNEVMAASLIGILPVLVIFPFLQRHIVAGLTAGAVKT